jgi:signal transduction histidine kinase
MRRRSSCSDPQVCATFTHLLRPGHHRFEVQVPQGLSLNSHPGALQQVLTNLIGNSLIHGFDGREGGTIRIEAHGTQQEVFIRYEDDGCGMAVETARRIYEPFYTTKLGQGGTGLGMHISHTLVHEVLGGGIEVHSAPGQGTRFEMQLPRVAPRLNDESGFGALISEPR